MWFAAVFLLLAVVSTVAFDIQPPKFTQVSAGGSHTCGVTNSGSIECFGSDSSDYQIIVGSSIWKIQHITNM